MECGGWTKSFTSKFYVSMRRGGRGVRKICISHEFYFRFVVSQNLDFTCFLLPMSGREGADQKLYNVILLPHEGESEVTYIDTYMHTYIHTYTHT